jgi:hypothetical protein
MDAFEVGEIRSVCINIDRIDPTAAGKRRPGVLVTPGRRAGLWMVMGLTTLTRYGDGSPREPLLEWRMSGLRRPTYLWGRNPVLLPDSDVGDLLGTVSGYDAATILTLLDSPLTTDEVDRFLASATDFSAPADSNFDAFAGLPA